jgi:hypothetical protein
MMTPTAEATAPDQGRPVDLFTPIQSGSYALPGGSHGGDGGDSRGVGTGPSRCAYLIPRPLQQHERLAAGDTAHGRCTLSQAYRLHPTDSAACHDPKWPPAYMVMRR